MADATDTASTPILIGRSLPLRGINVQGMAYMADRMHWAGWALGKALLDWFV